MSVTFESIRFGTVEIQEEDVIEFPFGLIGLGGLRYALLDRNPGTGFLWLHARRRSGARAARRQPAPVLLRRSRCRSPPRIASAPGSRTPPARSCT